LGIIPWAPSHAYANRGWEPSLNAAQPHAKAEGCVLEDLQADKLRKGWVFRVGTWSIDFLKAEQVSWAEALWQRKTGVACLQETRWRGSGCRLFGAIGKRYKLFWMASKD